MPSNLVTRQYPRKKTCVAEVPPYVDTDIERHCTKRVTTQSRALGTKLMRSERWCPGVDSKNRLRVIPYIMKSGHISGSSLLTWKCTAAQWFATTVRAVIERIRHRNVVMKRSKYKKQRHLTEIALFYVLTNSDQLLERLLCCHRRGFRSLITYLKNTLDDKMRFCYDQALQDALWFELRGYPRAQSNIENGFVVVYEPMVHSRQRQMRECLNTISDPWIVNGFLHTKMNRLAAWAV